MVRLRIEKIREYMEAQNLSQNALARRADMDVKTIQRLFREPTAEFSSYTLGKLASALGVSSNELIEDVKEKLYLYNAIICNHPLYTIQLDMKRGKLIMWRYAWILSL